MSMTSLPDALLSRIEDAGLNASAPPQQLWMDGWLLRFSPGSARRARCINAVAAGRLPWQQKLAQATAHYADRRLPLAIRITPFTSPSQLDAELSAAGFEAVDHTKVMVCTSLTVDLSKETAVPPGLRCEAVDPTGFAEAVGYLRASTQAQRGAHAERLAHTPVSARRLVLRREHDGAIAACAQSLDEAEFIGLYDVYVADDARGQGVAGWLCSHLLSCSARAGAAIGYLQVDEANHPARRLYARLGFTDAYGYHYRQPG